MRRHELSDEEWRSSHLFCPTTAVVSNALMTGE